MKNIIAIRTHSWGVPEQNLYNQLLTVFPSESIYAVIDETTNIINVPKYINKISLDHSFMQRNNLIDYNHYNMGIGWLCGDYFYYAIKEKIIADFYWLIEPDVAFTFRNINDFFSPIHELEDDAIFSNLRELPETDYWYKSALLVSELQCDKMYGCSFPLSRLSYRAIELCQNEREKLCQIYKENNAFHYKNNPMKIHFPNDEVLAVMTLMKKKKHGITIKSFSDIFPTSFAHFNYHRWYSIEQDEYYLPEKQVIHPARSIARHTKKITAEIIEEINNSNKLNYFIISQNDIELVSSAVASNLENYIKNYLTTQLTLIKVKHIVEETLENYTKSTKPWIWDNRVLVIDNKINNYTFTLDLKINSDDITCYTFKRDSNLLDWKEYIAEKHNLTIDDDKVVLFHSHINDENLNREIENAIKIFYDIPNIIKEK